MSYKSDIEDEIKALKKEIASEKMSDEEEYEITVDLVSNSDTWEILKTPGVMDAIQKYYHETILEKWKARREEDLKTLEEDLKLEENDYFSITSIHRDDIEEIFGENAHKITDEQMEYIAKKMADDYCEQLFWDSMEIIVENVTGLKPMPKDD